MTQSNPTAEDPIEVVPAVVRQNGVSVDVQAAVTPTQLRHPRRSMWRTALQCGVSSLLLLGVVVPQAVSIVLEEAGESMPTKVRLVLLAASGVITVASTALARIMAIPEVEQLLRRYKLTRGLAAAPTPKA